MLQKNHKYLIYYLVIASPFFYFYFFRTKIPNDMIWIPGGTFLMGSNNPVLYDSQPIHEVFVDGFFMDITPVTNEQFARFVKETGYITVAEQMPVLENFQDTNKAELIAGSLVFCPPKHPVNLRDYWQWWRFVPGACWHSPEGPGSSIKSRLKHPVVHIAWHDAVAYARWAGKRLPTEAEFEYAARGGLCQNTYSWGNILKPAGVWLANIWQGIFPHYNSKEDGFEGTSPVSSYACNGFGLYDMTGNVWQWCSDWYDSNYYKQCARNPITKNPKGPVKSYDPQEILIPKKVQRSGSFLCNDRYCIRYQVGARGKCAVDSGASHTGFRCVKNRG